jgi:DNA topoisomerase IA
MRVAQGLYEDGSITYMRTDGIDMAPEAVSAARRAIASRYSAGFVPDRPRQYQSKIKNAQEAHEAIYPPITPIALASVPSMMVRRPATPSRSEIPPPWSPYMPTAWTSSR